jgi:phospholipase A-2-activating protein
LISCSWDKTIKIWEEDKENIFKCKKILKHSKWISSLLLLEDKNLLISSGKDGTKFWNLNDYTCINHIQETFCEISNSLKRLNEDKIIIGGNNDGIIKVISIKDKRIIKEIKNEFKCLGICVVENKGIFLIGGESNDIKVYRSDNFNCIQILKDAHKDFINGLTQLKDCSIASYGADKSIKIWSF